MMFGCLELVARRDQQKRPLLSLPTVIVTSFCIAFMSSETEDEFFNRCGAIDVLQPVKVPWWMSFIRIVMRGNAQTLLRYFNELSKIWLACYRYLLDMKKKFNLS